MRITESHWPWIPAAIILMLWGTGAEARHTSSIVLTPDEKTVCAVNQDSGSISLWDWLDEGPGARDQGRVREIEVGCEPRTLAVSPDGRRLYVTNQCSQTLSVVDLVKEEVVATIELGGQPYGVVVSEGRGARGEGRGARAFVSQYAGGYAGTTYCAGIVTVIDLASHAPIKRIPVAPRPWAMALRPDEQALYVTHYLHVDGKGIVTEIDPGEYTIRRQITLEEDDDVVGGRGGVFNGLAGIVLHPNGRRALVVGMHANTRRGLALSGRQLSHKTTVQAAIRVLDLDEGRELPEARMVSSFSGQAVAVPAAVAFIGLGVGDSGLGTGGSGLEPAASIPSSQIANPKSQIPHPSSLAHHFIDLYFASNDLKVLRYNERGYVAERALLEVPPGPTGVVVTRDGQTALVNSRFGRSISQLSVADVRQLRVVKTVRTTAEPWDEQRLRGAILFHNTRDTRMTANRWISCGVCHLDGGLVSDSVMWDLTVEGYPAKVSNTMDLVTTPGTSPPFFHRGTPDVVHALEEFVHIFHSGSGFLALPPGNTGNPASQHMGGPAGEWDAPPEGNGQTSEEWAAILAYMESLRPRPNPHMDTDQKLPRAEIRESARRGRTLFFDQQVGCNRCHSGPHLTVSGKHRTATLFDVGTGKKLDVPPLLHLWDTAPYLHDGRAKTLREVLTTCNPEDKHGKTSHLSDQEIDDLATFLLAPFEEKTP